MKFYSLFMLLLGSCFQSNGQSISRSVINANGNAYMIGAGRLQQSVGEAVVGRIHTQLSQGFLCGMNQPAADSVLVPPVPDTAWFRYFPNPVHDRLYFSGSRQGIRYIQLYDLAGRRFAQLSIVQQSVSLRAIPNGVYIATALNGAGERLHTFKIIKY